MGVKIVALRFPRIGNQNPPHTQRRQNRPQPIQHLGPRQSQKQIHRRTRRTLRRRLKLQTQLPAAFQNASHPKRPIHHARANLLTRRGAQNLAHMPRAGIRQNRRPVRLKFLRLQKNQVHGCGKPLAPGRRKRHTICTSCFASNAAISASCVSVRPMASSPLNNFSFTSGVISNENTRSASP